MPSPQRHKPPEVKSQEGSKMRSKNHQADKRQFKVRLLEKPLVLPQVSVTLIPTTVVTTLTTTPTMISNPSNATTPWPSNFSASANLFVTRSWPMCPNKEDNPMLVPEKNKIKGLELSKSKNSLQGR